MGTNPSPFDFAAATTAWACAAAWTIAWAWAYVDGIVRDPVQKRTITTSREKS